MFLTVGNGIKKNSKQKGQNSKEYKTVFLTQIVVDQSYLIVSTQKTCAYYPMVPLKSPSMCSLVFSFRHLKKKLTMLTISRNSSYSAHNYCAVLFLYLRVFFTSNGDPCLQNVEKLLIHFRLDYYKMRQVESIEHIF